MAGRGDRVLCGTDRTYIDRTGSVEDDLTEHMDFYLTPRIGIRITEFPPTAILRLAWHDPRVDAA